MREKDRWIAISVDKAWDIDIECIDLKRQTGGYLSLELLDNVSEEVLVKVFSSQEGVSIGGLDLEDALLDLQH